MNVFRFIGDKQFLIGIGRDNSETCTGFVNPSDGRSTNMAVSVIDVQDLSKIRLVQRKCVAVEDAGWVNSEINNNLDQAHKMIGMHSDGTVNAITIPVYYYKKSEILVYDLSDPANPVQRGSVELPYSVMPYYYYWCGVDAYFLANIYDNSTHTTQRKLLFVELSNTDAPALTEYTLATADTWQFFSLIPDPINTGAFFLTYRTKLGEYVIDDTTFSQFKYYAQRWTKSMTTWTSESAINLPGRLMKTWSQGGDRVFLTHDTTYKQMQLPDQDHASWKSSFRVNLLKQISPWGEPLAELKDFHNFESFLLEDMVVDVSDPAHPFGQQFMRTLGYTTHIEFADNTAYLAAGYFGIYQMDLGGTPVIPSL